MIDLAEQLLGLVGAQAGIDTGEMRLRLTFEQLHQTSRGAIQVVPLLTEPGFCRERGAKKGMGARAFFPSGTGPGEGRFVEAPNLSEAVRRAGFRNISCNPGMRRYTPLLWNELIDFSEEKLAAIDPVVMNLAVAKGILPLADLNIPAYQRTIDLWAKDIERRLPEWMEEFSRRPQDWNNDVDEFRLGLVSYYVAKFLGVRYIEEQRGAVHVAYTNPSNLFLNGVMDTRRGACGNMALLQVVLGRRLGWPVSVATARWHEFLRFDDGKRTLNVETSNIENGFGVNPDSYYIRYHGLRAEDLQFGSDLKFLQPRQLLALFFSLRGRHYYDMNNWGLAGRDYRIAKLLNPRSRLYREKFHELVELMELCDYRPNPTAILYHYE
jgi:hypothetical protein